MSLDAQPLTPEIRRRVRLLQGVTILRLLVESAVSLVAASDSRDLSLVELDGDRLVELLSATLALRSFGPK